MWFCAQSHYWPTPFFDNCFRFLTLIVLIPVHANFPFSIPYFCLILNFIHKRFSLRSHFSLLDRYVVKINILSTIHVVDSNGYFISWLTQCPVKTCEVGQKELKDVMYPFLFLIKKNWWLKSKQLCVLETHWQTEGYGWQSVYTSDSQTSSYMNSTCVRKKSSHTPHYS